MALSRRSGWQAMPPTMHLLCTGIGWMLRWVGIQFHLASIRHYLIPPNIILCSFFTPSLSLLYDFPTPFLLILTFLFC